MEKFSPLFVVPTRNRAELAMVAIESLLSQSVAPLNVWISDNSTDLAEVEKLRDYFTTCADPRLKYIRPPEPLSMGRHWDWIINKTLEDVSVSHVGFLTDRMLFVPGGLCMLLHLAQRYPQQLISYPHDHVEDIHKPVLLLQHQWTGRLLEVPSDAMLRDMRRRGWNTALPRMLNNLAPREVFETIRSRYRNVLDSTAPDICFGFRFLEQFETFLYFDKPVVADYAMSRSNGHSATLGRPTADYIDFLNNIGSRGVTYASPVPGLVCTPNVCFHEYNLVREQSRNPKMKRLNLFIAFRLIESSLQLIEIAIQRKAGEEAVARQRRATMKNWLYWKDLFSYGIQRVFAKTTPSYLRRKFAKILLKHAPGYQYPLWRIARVVGVSLNAPPPRISEWPDRQSALDCLVHRPLSAVPTRASLEGVVSTMFVELIDKA